MESLSGLLPDWCRAKRGWKRACGWLLIVWLGGAARVYGAEEGTLLWSVGAADGANGEFALAPGGYARFGEDGVFVVGRSDSRRDWPYVHPGPQDAWAGSRQHTFVIWFGVKSVAGQGKGKLRMQLLDTQAAAAPELEVLINGTSFRRKLAAGAGDASVSGRPEGGRRQLVEIEFPVELLQAGANEVALTTVSGSWLLYDWLGLEVPAGVEAGRMEGTGAVGLTVTAPGLLREAAGGMRQPVRVSWRQVGEAQPVAVRVGGEVKTNLPAAAGRQVCELWLPAVAQETPVEVGLEMGGRGVGMRRVSLMPVRRLTIYILPHSHTDIGYTEIQTDIEEKQVNNLVAGIEHARRTAGYPPGARFVWNVEVSWAADLYLRRLDAGRRREFREAVRRGQVALHGMYLNELTGLCRPEELVRLFRYSTRLAEECGVPVDSVMISDVPGYTWGTVTAMAQAGLRYFSTAPNYFDRIGDILVQWENRPFYWVGPSGREEVLVWIPFKGYAMSHMFRRLTPEFVEQYLGELAKTGYAYDIAHMRWSGHGDNAVPDPAICDFVRDWNARHAWPRFVISSTSEAFRAFEREYGARLPRVAGDWTPYWEDGAGSSALETAMNRASSDRMIQAEALWAMLSPGSYPSGEFEAAWRSVLLYSEHTWGAWCSVGEPRRRETLEQWQIKHSYAAEADARSRDLLNRALALPAGGGVADAIDLFNTTSWARTEWVMLPKDFTEGGDRVMDEAGTPVPSQRLTSGELVVLARDVPPFAARRYRVGRGAPERATPGVTVEGTVLDNGLVRVRLDERTGDIVELRPSGGGENLVDAGSGPGLNGYLYFTGSDAGPARGSGPVKVRVGEKGPLVGSLVAESEAPGCHRLVREVRLVAGMDRVEVVNLVDKARLEAANYHAAEGKESLNFSFPFRVPGGQVRLEVPFGVLRPDADQLPSACKNWFTVGRWADVSNDRSGVTWVTLDAPLVQVGGLTANLLNSQTNPEVWRKRVGPTQRLDSWAMNNHWGTNYRAYQEGPVLFRYLLRPHRGYDPMGASRLAIAASQPLLPVRARGGQAMTTPRLQVTSGDVLVTGLKPSDDRKACVVRLWGAAGKDVRTSLRWSEPAPRRVRLSDTSERGRGRGVEEVEVPGWGLVTLRAEVR